MSRPIEFRAWFPKGHYSEPHMAYLDINDDFGGASATWQLRYLMHPELDEGEGPIYMQYTGLKDRNGVKIFEGDIVSLPNYPFIDEGKQNYVGIVMWLHAGFQYVLQCVNPDKRGISDGIAAPLEEDKRFEVLGNIHQNGDLLK